MLGNARKSDPVGLLAVPYTNNDDTGADITVISPVEDKLLSALITLLHVGTWIAAIALSCLARNHLVEVKYMDVLEDGSVGQVSPSEACKALADMQIIMTSVSFAFTALYGALVSKKDTPAPILGALLLATIISTVMISGANLTITTIVKDIDTYNMSLVAGITVATASSMVFAFYIHFAKSGQGEIQRPDFP